MLPHRLSRMLSRRPFGRRSVGDWARDMADLPFMERRDRLAAAVADGGISREDAESVLQRTTEADRLVREISRLRAAAEVVAGNLAVISATLAGVSAAIDRTAAANGMSPQDMRARMTAGRGRREPQEDASDRGTGMRIRYRAADGVWRDALLGEFGAPRLLLTDAEVSAIEVRLAGGALPSEVGVIDAYVIDPGDDALIRAGAPAIDTALRGIGRPVGGR